MLSIRLLECLSKEELIKVIVELDKQNVTLENTLSVYKHQVEVKDSCINTLEKSYYQLRKLIDECEGRLKEVYEILPDLDFDMHTFYVTNSKLKQEVKLTFDKLEKLNATHL